MKARTNLLARLALATAVSVGLAACGGSSNNTPETPAPEKHDPLPAGHGLTDGDPVTISAGESLTTSTGTISCPEDGADCVISVVKKVDGSYEATSTGGDAMFAVAPTPPPPPPPAPTALDRAKTALMEAQTALAALADDASLGAQEKAQTAVRDAARTLLALQEDAPASEYKVTEKAFDDAMDALTEIADDQDALESDLADDVTAAEQAVASADRADYRAIRDARRDLVAAHQALVNALVDHGSDADDAQDALDDAQADLSRSLTDAGIAEDRLAAAQARYAALSSSATLEEQLAAQEAIRDAADVVIAEYDAEDASRETYIRVRNIREAAIDMIGRLTTAIATRDSEEEDLAKTRLSMGKAFNGKLGLFVVSGGASPTTTLTSTSSSTGRLSIDPVDGNGGRPAGTTPTSFPGSDAARSGLRVATGEGTSSGTEGSWAFATYRNAGTPITDHAILFHNQDAPTSKAFTTAVTGLTESSTPGVFEVGTGADGDIRAADFPAGSTNYPEGSRTITGEYMGAPGQYKCTGATCTALRGTNGVMTLSAGDWTFTPSGPVQEPDGAYAFFGWWEQRDASLKSEPLRVAPFFGVVGQGSGAASIQLIDDVPARFLSGGAKYSGKAAGKYSIYDSKAEIGNAGSFVADAMLEAKFSGTTSTLEGTIHRFVAEDPTASKWSVKLNPARWNTSQFDDDNSTTTVDAANTTWTIDGNASAKGGTWSASVYHDRDHVVTKGNNNAATDVLGTFHAEATSTHNIVGAFGAELTED